jgi:hypothetical protein
MIYHYICQKNTFLLMIHYKKLFGTIRILLGILFFAYPAIEYFNSGEMQSESSMRWLFVMIFFIAYAYSSIRNGIREIGGYQPAFNLLRFFEASMNGFIAVYIVILLFAASINNIIKFPLFILFLLTFLSMVRDIRIISIQYLDRKHRARK